MAYRTRTYIAADWDTDEGAVSVCGTDKAMIARCVKKICFDCW